MSIRWEEEARSGAEFLGWKVVRSDGVSDYQGWGVLLLYKVGDDLLFKDCWATLGWDYGSCSYCDSYEDQNTSTPEACAAVFSELIHPAVNQRAAELDFSSRKGW